MKNLILKIIKSEKGQGLAEYSLLLSLISILAIGGLVIFGERVRGLYEQALSRVSNLP